MKKRIYKALVAFKKNHPVMYYITDTICDIIVYGAVVLMWAMFTIWVAHQAYHLGIAKSFDTAFFTTNLVELLAYLLLREYKRVVDEEEALEEQRDCYYKKQLQVVEDVTHCGKSSPYELYNAFATEVNLQYDFLCWCFENSNQLESEGYAISELKPFAYKLR